MTKVMRCIYCKSPCRVLEEKNKMVMICPKCGKKELTKLGLAKMEAMDK